MHRTHSVYTYLLKRTDRAYNWQLSYTLLIFFVHSFKHVCVFIGVFVTLRWYISGPWNYVPKNRFIMLEPEKERKKGRDVQYGVCVCVYGSMDAASYSNWAQMNSKQQRTICWVWRRWVVLLLLLQRNWWIGYCTRRIGSTTNALLEKCVQIFWLIYV